MSIEPEPKNIVSPTSVNGITTQRSIDPLSLIHKTGLKPALLKPGMILPLQRVVVFQGNPTDIIVTTQGIIGKDAPSQTIEPDPDNLLDAEDPTRALYWNDIRALEQKRGAALLTPDQEHALAVRKDEQAIQEMIEANLRLVVSKAVKIYGIIPNKSTTTLNDLIQAGNIGLIRAVDGFNPDKGFRFSTYATWWIFREMLAEMADNERTIRIPREKLQAIAKAQRITNGQQPSDGETEKLLIEAGYSPAQATNIIGTLNFPTFQRTESLNQPIRYGEEDACVGDFVVDDTVDVEKSAANKVDCGLLLDELKRKLSPREFEVIVRRFGLGEGDPFVQDFWESGIYEPLSVQPQAYTTRNLGELTREDIGQAMGISRERVRQIEAEALEKITKDPKLMALLSSGIPIRTPLPQAEAALGAFENSHHFAEVDKFGVSLSLAKKLISLGAKTPAIWESLAFETRIVLETLFDESLNFQEAEDVLKTLSDDFFTTEKDIIQQIASGLTYLWNLLRGKETYFGTERSKATLRRLEIIRSTLQANPKVRNKEISEELKANGLPTDGITISSFTEDLKKFSLVTNPEALPCKGQIVFNPA